jgi:hypothetical protein
MNEIITRAPVYAMRVCDSCRKNVFYESGHCPSICPLCNGYLIKEDAVTRARNLVKWAEDGQLVHRDEWLKVLKPLLETFDCSHLPQDAKSKSDPEGI